MKTVRPGAGRPGRPRALACETPAAACDACSGGRGCALRWLSGPSGAVLEVPAQAWRMAGALVQGRRHRLEVIDGELLRAALPSPTCRHSRACWPVPWRAIGAAVGSRGGRGRCWPWPGSPAGGPCRGHGCAARRRSPACRRRGPVNPEAIAGLVLYVREGCHLCDQFLLELSARPRARGRAPAGRATSTGTRSSPCASACACRSSSSAAQVLCEGVYDGAGVRRALGL